MVEMIPLFGPIPGGMEMMVILLIAVLLFGANKIPKLARSTGEAMGEFKKGRQEVEQELQEMQDPDLDADTDTDSEPIGEASTDSATDSETETETSTE
ncbi:twin-arginine translocase TatA/TatE family subunit [Halorussus salilacus]|uniref:twin-arginine translocase TatA/TatE family subunit n=1 Tax=Halorussus salilacus TaxID=2953750 RepID=UPI00209DECE1|nr:twin-arginine translocase TatA/TatE family subunit [Halorussus salilacus]USZ68688.1 twin-arginine translocase TatA/TatE family subunit [Halorussus salilacus]